MKTWISFTIAAICILLAGLACQTIGGLAALPTPTPTREMPPSPDTPAEGAKENVTDEPGLPPSPVPGMRGERPFTIPLPPAGKIYHAAYPGGTKGDEDDISGREAYEYAAGKSLVWVYFSHNWYVTREFPRETVDAIRQAGSIPYIRLMLRSDSEQYHADLEYAPQRILDGDFDEDLHVWMQDARNLHTPLIVEYGTEMNGEWFPWNGTWNGAGESAEYGDVDVPDGPERFRDAYRRIIDIARAEAAANITWVFHVNDYDIPDEDWNHLENYYPGDEYIDWLGMSVYGAQTPLDETWQPFRTSMDGVYLRLARLSADKPIALCEFGATSGNPHVSQAEWAEEALKDITDLRWQRLFAFSWWNDFWQNDDDPAHDTDMRVQTNPELEAVFRQYVGDNPAVLGELVTESEESPAP